MSFNKNQIARTKQVQVITANTRGNSLTKNPVFVICLVFLKTICKSHVHCAQIIRLAVGVYNEVYRRYLILRANVYFFIVNDLPILGEQGPCN